MSCKKLNIGIRAMFAAAILITAANVPVKAEEEKEMYRLYNKNSGEHLYTAKAGERDDLVKIGWQYEGIGWYAPETSATPVYRLYNKYGGEHHYTVNEVEKDALVKVGWTDEGIGWDSDDNHTVVLYREYNPNARSCNHNYTTNQKEHEALIGIGWNNEGTAWYGIKEGNPITPASEPEKPKGCSVDGKDTRCLTGREAYDEACDFIIENNLYGIGFHFGEASLETECYVWFLNDGSAGGGANWQEVYKEDFQAEIRSGKNPLPNYDFCIGG